MPFKSSKDKAETAADPVCVDIDLVGLMVENIVGRKVCVVEGKVCREGAFQIASKADSRCVLPRKGPGECEECHEEKPSESLICCFSGDEERLQTEGGLSVNWV